MTHISKEQGKNKFCHLMLDLELINLGRTGKIREEQVG
jgi:hypothetical protein